MDKKEPPIPQWAKWIGASVAAVASVLGVLNAYKSFVDDDLNRQDYLLLLVAVVLLTIVFAWLARLGRKSADSDDVHFTENPEVRSAYLKYFYDQIDELLKGSIHRARHIEIEGEERTDLTVPWEYRADSRYFNYTGTSERFESLQHAYEDLNGRVLVLGGPGSGKTTALRSLAKGLAKSALDDIHAPIPVFFELSRLDLGGEFDSDSKKAISTRDTSKNTGDQIRDQITRFLASRGVVGLTAGVAQGWMELGRVVLILDGLDEVYEDRRGAVIAALQNGYFESNKTLPIVLASRRIEYEAIAEDPHHQLRLNGAIVLEPLSLEKIKLYLRKADATALLDLLPESSSEGFEDFWGNPLILSMLTLAYGGARRDQIPDLSMPVERRRRVLFDRFVDRAMQRQALKDEEDDGPQKPVDWNPAYNLPTPYKRKQVNRYLGWLALRMSERDRIFFPKGQLTAFLNLRTNLQKDKSVSALDIGSVIFAAALSSVVGAAFGIFGAPETAPFQFAVFAGSIGLVTCSGFLLVDGLSRRAAELLRGLTGLAIAVLIIGVGSAAIADVISAGFGWSLGPFALSTVLVAASGSGVSTRRAWRSALCALGLGLIGVAGLNALGLSAYSGAALAVIAIANVALAFLAAPNESDRTVGVAIGVGLVTFASVVAWAGSRFVGAPDEYEAGAWLAAGIGSLAAFLPNGYRLDDASWGAPLATIVAATFVTVLFLFGPSWAIVASIVLAGVGAIVSSRYGPTMQNAIVDLPTRFVLFALRKLPLRIGLFLGYCDKAFLLRKSGADYQFIHRRLRDYFAIEFLEPQIKEAEGDELVNTIDRLSRQGDFAVEFLAEFASREDEQTRVAALAGLARLATPDAVSVLKGVLNQRDPDLASCRAVIRGMGSLEADERGELVNIGLRHSINEVRYETIAFVLGESFFQMPVSSYQYLLSQSDPRQVEGASVLLYQNQYSVEEWEWLEEYEDTLRGLLHSSNEIAHAAAVSLLGRIAKLDSMPAIIHQLSDASPAVRKEAMGAIEALCWKFYMDVSQIDERVYAAITDARESSDGPLRIAAISLAGNLAARFNESRAVGLVIDGLDDREEDIRASAILYLDSANSDSSLARKLIKCLDDPSAKVRTHAAIALTGVSEATEALINGLRDKKSGKDAASALGEIEGDDLRKRLGELLHTRTRLVRENAARAIGAMKAREHIPKIRDLLERDSPGWLSRLLDIKSWTRGSGFTQALGDLQDQEAVPLLIRALEEGNPSLRRDAATALGKLKSEEAIESLAEAQLDKNYDVRLEAKKALREVGSQAALAVLRDDEL